jgi:hypothetical protein
VSAASDPTPVDPTSLDDVTRGALERLSTVVWRCLEALDRLEAEQARARQTAAPPDAPHVPTPRKKRAEAE